MKRSLALVLVLSAAVAQATTLSDFKLADIKGLTVTEPSPLAFTLSFQKGATVTIGTKTYDLKSVSGFYKLAHEGKFTAASSKQTPYGWSTKSLNTAKNVVGWQTSYSSKAIKSSGSANFAFKALTSTTDAQINNGFKVIVTDKNFCDYTMYVYSKSFAPVPEPTSMAILGFGGLAFLRRRFKKS